MYSPGPASPATATCNLVVAFSPLAAVLFVPPRLYYTSRCITVSLYVSRNVLLTRNQVYPSCAILWPSALLRVVFSLSTRSVISVYPRALVRRNIYIYFFGALTATNVDPRSYMWRVSLLLRTFPLTVILACFSARRPARLYSYAHPACPQRVVLSPTPLSYLFNFSHFHNDISLALHRRTRQLASA